MASVKNVLGQPLGKSEPQLNTKAAACISVGGVIACITLQPCSALHNHATLPYTGVLLSNVDSPVCFWRVSHTKV